MGLEKEPWVGSWGGKRGGGVRTTHTHTPTHTRTHNLVIVTDFNTRGCLKAQGWGRPIVSTTLPVYIRTIRKLANYWLDITIYLFSTETLPGIYSVLRHYHVFILY